MTTARDLIKGALRKIHELGIGSELDATEANDALLVLNAMLASWSADGNKVFTQTNESLPLTGGVSSYSIGPGGDFDTGRPVRITSAYVRIGTIDYSLTEIDRDEYARISYKNTSSIPEYYYYDANFPLANIVLYPAPTTGTLYIDSYKYITSFTDLDTDFAMPPEYEAALIYNLAVWIAPEYEREAGRTVMNIANETKKVIEGQNRRRDIPRSYVDMPVNSSRGGSYDINRGTER